MRTQPIWRELREKNAIPEHAVQETKTIVTPYVFECFSQMRFWHHHRAVDTLSSVQSQQASQGRASHLTVSDNLHRPFMETSAYKRAYKLRSFFPSNLIGKPRKVEQKPLFGKHTYFVRSENDSDENDDQDASEDTQDVPSEEEESPVSPSSFSPPALLNRFNSRTCSTPKSSPCKMPSRAKPKIVINLILRRRGCRRG